MRTTMTRGTMYMVFMTTMYTGENNDARYFNVMKIDHIEHSQQLVQSRG